MNKTIKEMMHYTVQLMILLILSIAALVLLFLLTIIGSVLVAEFSPSVIAITGLIVIALIFGWSVSGLFEVYDNRKASRRKSCNVALKNVAKYKDMSIAPQIYYVGKIHKK